MPKNEFALAFNEVLEEKQLSKDIILGAIESAMVSAYRRAVNASTAQQVEAKVDTETGKVTIFAEKEVVEDVQEDKTEVTLEEARKVNPEAQLGDMVLVESTPSDFGRVAAQTARQVIQQRIREAERSAQMEYFARQTGEIVSGIVQTTNMQAATIGLDMKAEGILPANQKIPNERYRLHDRIRAVVLEVKDGSRGPQIILSRAHRNFLRRLLENEVPEIYHGIVEIRAIAREPGARAKVAVMATQPGVDPVGACVGIKGVRIQAIVKELHDEKIDIIQWDPDPGNLHLEGHQSGAGQRRVPVGCGRQSHRHRRRHGRSAEPGDRPRWTKRPPGGQADRLAHRHQVRRRVRRGCPVEAAGRCRAWRRRCPRRSRTFRRCRKSSPKKAENRPVTPEEYSLIAQFVDRVERRTIQIKEEAIRAGEERVAAARAEIPPVAFSMPLEGLGLKEHVYNILVEAGYETIGDLMLALKLDENKVLGLAGVGPKAIENMHERLAATEFPELPVEVAPDEAVVEVSGRGRSCRWRRISRRRSRLLKRRRTPRRFVPGATREEGEEDRSRERQGWRLAGRVVQAEA